MTAPFYGVGVTRSGCVFFCTMSSDRLSRKRPLSFLSDEGSDPPGNAPTQKRRRLFDVEIPEHEAPRYRRDTLAHIRSVRGDAAFRNVQLRNMVRPPREAIYVSSGSEEEDNVASTSGAGVGPSAPIPIPVVVPERSTFVSTGRAGPGFDPGLGSIRRVFPLRGGDDFVVEERPRVGTYFVDEKIAERQFYEREVLEVREIDGKLVRLYSDGSRRLVNPVAGYLSDDEMSVYSSDLEAIDDMEY